MPLTQKNIIIHVVFFFFSLSFINLPFGLAALAPSQPLEGPGGSDYIHSQVTMKTYGTGALQYYLFEPDSPMPVSAPLIVFLHGSGETNPDSYSEWIKHMVKKGNIVVYPVYQSSFMPERQCLSDAIQTVLDSIEKLETEEDHVRPEPENFALVGHSFGAMLTVNIAALAEKYSLPVPKAIMSVEPGSFPSLFPFKDLSLVPSEALLLTVAGDKDFIVGDKGAKEILEGTTQIPTENKNLVIMISDQLGTPSLKADHSAPLATSSERSSSSPVTSSGLSSSRGTFTPDPLDYYGLWKLFDSLTDAAFYGQNWEYALGNTPEQRYMGEWSDGTAVKELIVIDSSQGNTP